MAAVSLLGARVSARSTVSHGGSRRAPRRTAARPAAAAKDPPPGFSVAAPPKPPSDWRAVEAERRRVSERSQAADAAAIAAAKAAAARKAGSVELKPGDAPSLAALEATPFIDPSTGDVPSAEALTGGAKASACVYAVLGPDGSLQYVGVTRAIRASLRLHLGRTPSKCGSVKVAAVQRPSRALLEAIRTAWVLEAGAPPGNDGAEGQAMWEGPVDCWPLMTADERAAVDDAPEGPRRKGAVKRACRRVESGIKEEMEKLGFTGNARFDPKLKEQGKLDLIAE